MVRRDYILQIIEEFARVIAHVTHAKQMQEYNRAFLHLQSFGRKLDPDFGTTMRYSDEALRDAVMTNGVFDSERCRLFAQVQCESGELLALMYQRDLAAEAFGAALRLLIMLVEHDADNDHDTTVLEDLVTKLGVHTLPSTAKHRLGAALERIGNFAAAETVFFDLLEHDRSSAHILAAFYERMLEMTDDELRTGNFSRKEITQGLEDMYKLLQAPSSLL